MTDDSTSPDRPEHPDDGERADETAPGDAAGSATDTVDEPPADTVDGASADESTDDESTADEPETDESTTDEPADDATADDDAARTAAQSVPADVRKYDRFTKMDGARYDRANEFLRDRTYITAREWAIARLCADFRTETGVEMTKIGEHLPELVPFMTDTYTPQAVNQARAAFEEKVRMAGATFLYGAMSDLFTAEGLDDVMYEATEVAKFLLEVEGVDLAVDEELDAEERISSTMREVRTQSAALRHDDLTCPHCGESFELGDAADETTASEDEMDETEADPTPSS